MPNYVNNIVSAPQRVLDALKKKDADNTVDSDGAVDNSDMTANFSKAPRDDADELVDFNSVLPMPADIFRGPLGAAEEAKYGDRNWYDWSLANWGTKWNAIDPVEYGDGVSFQTAWSHPSPVIEELSTMFPDDEIRVAYADEDIGYNLGVYSIKNGEVTDYHVSDLPESIRFEVASHIFYGDSLKTVWGEDEDDADTRVIYDEIDKYAEEHPGFFLSEWPYVGIKPLDSE